MKPRLLCRLVRSAGAFAEPSFCGHVARCVDCQKHLRAHAALETSLRRDAGSSGFAPRPGFEARVLAAVRCANASELRVETADAAHTEPVRFGRGFWQVGVAAAVLMLGSFLVLRRPAPTPVIGAVKTEAVNVAASDTTAAARAIASTVESLSQRLVDDVIPTAGTAIAENPLQSEFTAVYADAQAALDFLALNFLPRARTSAADAPPRRGTG